MTAFSDYMESGLLHHIFRGQTLAKPSQIAIALTSGVPSDSSTGATLPEIPSGIDGGDSGYTRTSLGAPSSSGDSTWNYTSANHAVGSGVISNASNIVFSQALKDWGWVSGFAIVDHSSYGSGNVIMRAQLSNPRVVYTGDIMKFDAGTLKINIK